VCNNESALVGLREAALQVARSLDDLMKHIRRGTTTTYEGTQVIFAYADLLCSYLFMSLRCNRNDFVRFFKYEYFICLFFVESSCGLIHTHA